MYFVSLSYFAALPSLYTDPKPIHTLTELTASSHQVPHHNNFDGLDKAFVLFRLPPKAGMKGRRLHRRVDLICAPRKRYALAVVGWSGSMMFERDLR